MLSCRGIKDNWYIVGFNSIGILLNLKEVLKFNNGSWDGSVSIVSGYGLDDRAIEVRSPAEAS
jgi:hypothetical protein